MGVIDEKFVRKFSRSFIYAGTAMRSGGRMGVPAETEKLDKQRPHVHDLLLKAYGDDGYRHAQAADCDATLIWELKLPGYAGTF